MVGVIKMNKIVVFSASNSVQSINRSIAKIVIEKLTNKNTLDIVSADICDYPLSLFSQELEERDGIPIEAHTANKLFRNCNAAILCIPEHNGSMSAVFKNFIDWLSRLDEKTIFPKELPLLLLSTSPGARGGLTNLNHLADLMPWWGGNVHGKLAIGDYYNNFHEEKLSANYDEQLEKLLNSFVFDIQNLQQAS